jgi:hypothetical protein
MNKLIPMLAVVATFILVGCSTESDHPSNIITISPSEGTAYLNASREVIESKGWTVVSERGSTTGKAAEQVTITGQSVEGKKVFFTARFTAKPKKACLEVTTEGGFPISPVQLIGLVKNKHDK